jgi:hypothetical protein
MHGSDSTLLKDELLNETLFRSLGHAKELLIEWRDDYIGCRPRTSPKAHANTVSQLGPTMTITRT